MTPWLEEAGPPPTIVYHPQVNIEEVATLEPDLILGQNGRVDEVYDLFSAITPPGEHAWAEFVPFLNFDPEIRAVICTTNTIESLNARFRRAVKTRGHFPTEQAGPEVPVPGGL